MEMVVVAAAECPQDQAEMEEMEEIEEETSIMLGLETLMQTLLMQFPKPFKNKRTMKKILLKMSMMRTISQ
jgi:hypothetical protein